MMTTPDEALDRLRAAMMDFRQQVGRRPDHDFPKREWFYPSRAGRRAIDARAGLLAAMLGWPGVMMTDATPAWFPVVARWFPSPLENAVLHRRRGGWRKLGRKLDQDDHFCITERDIGPFVDDMRPGLRALGLDIAELPPSWKTTGLLSPDFGAYLIASHAVFQGLRLANGHGSRRYIGPDILAARGA